MLRRFIFCVVLLCSASVFCFGQTSALRDYVGMISQGFHPDIITFLEKLQSDLEKRGYSAAARNLGVFIKGESGTGFVYVAGDGKNYILTNYHVISQSHTLSLTFENLEGEKTKFSDLTIVAADEDLDIALLSFAGGQNPFRQGLAFLNRPVQEGEDVYSAGFPEAGTAMIWQLGRGIISNAAVRFPPEDENDKIIGPYIQHTAQVDAGNSGGPLLVQTTGVPTGFAVAGINTLSILSRQAANYSIPLNRIQAFLDTSMEPPVEDQKPLLEARVNAFVEGMSVPRAVYPHIALFVSNICTGENAEYAIFELLERASRPVRDDVFDRNIISSMTYAVAWTVEDRLRSKSGKISIDVDSIEPGEEGAFNVSFNVNDTTISSVWINEYGIWRIRSFGDFAAGDKTLIGKREKEKAEKQNLRSEPVFQISAGLAYPFELGPAFGIDFGARIGKYFGIGMKGFFGKGYAQLEISPGVFFPIPAGSVAFTPYVKGGLGIMPIKGGDSFIPPIGISFQGGLQFTTAIVPGLYLQMAYQYNFYRQGFFDSNGKQMYPHLMFISTGYSF